MSEKGRPLFYIDQGLIVYKKRIIDDVARHFFYIRLENRGDSAAESLSIPVNDDCEITDPKKRILYRYFLAGPLTQSILGDGKATVLGVRVEHRNEKGEDLFRDSGHNVEFELRYCDLNGREYTQKMSFMYQCSKYGRVEIMEVRTR